EIEVISQLQRTRTLFPRALLDSTRRHFVQHKGDAYRTLEQADLDPAGAQRIRQYLDAFYGAIESDDRFYRPVVVAANTVAYRDADRAAPACPAPGTVPIGTPASQPLERSGDMVQVVLLDALWHWYSPTKCPAVLKGAVWIDGGAVGTALPK